MKLSLINKTITVENIGTITITKKRRNRRICIRVSNNTVKVSIPYYASFKDAENFIYEKYEWINSALNKIKISKPQITESTEIFTLIGTIKFTKNECNRIRIITNSNGFNVIVPHDYDFSKKQNELTKYVISWLKKQAKSYLEKKTEEIAKRYGFKYEKIKISSARSRWGSCSNKNVICLNYRLLFLPVELCDYVILHELVHTIKRNHGTDFWKTLSSIDINAKEKDKKLKQYKIFHFI